MTDITTDIHRWLHVCADRVERELERWLPAASQPPEHLHAAMRYAVLGSGKRVRAALVYAAGEACRRTVPTPEDEAALDHAAAAVELIHAYSLVHDDLPCMDNDTLRRGRPTVHVEYGVATAMLAGDALQPLAFRCLTETPTGSAQSAAQVVAAMRTLAHAAGSLGMAGGQAIDLASVAQPLSVKALQTMHRMKTGAMLNASVTLGGIASAASEAQHRALDAYSQAIGLAFQVVDDILDVTADTASLGKTAGKDAADRKPTYVSRLGLDHARHLAEKLRADAHAALASLGPRAAQLAGLADFVVARTR